VVPLKRLETLVPNSIIGLLPGNMPAACNLLQIISGGSPPCPHNLFVFILHLTCWYSRRSLSLGLCRFPLVLIQLFPVFLFVAGAADDFRRVALRVVLITCSYSYWHFSVVVHSRAWIAIRTGSTRGALFLCGGPIQDPVLTSFPCWY